ncbi:MAG: hypothetical protein HY774_29950 [Acidobacteria bacterium]|nr:hypothetical protein [Acidobacteriota bacterium]
MKKFAGALAVPRWCIGGTRWCIGGTLLVHWRYPAGALAVPRWCIGGTSRPCNLLIDLYLQPFF